MSIDLGVSATVSRKTARSMIKIKNLDDINIKNCDKVLFVYSHPDDETIFAGGFYSVFDWEWCRFFPFLFYREAKRVLCVSTR